MSAHLTRPLLIFALALVPPLGIVSAAATPTGPSPAVTTTSESSQSVRDASVRDASVGSSPACDWRYGGSCVVGGRM
ncbi:hypothetical protein [Streptomyces sp. A1499]|uniref:hypothetical protein n=1 Tax=Streptomyces sp. A1499 TaxID=2563104 RepID=UPI00109ED939|nr:hypothetical protein [Streptomyces sp. A1499]THC50510.1 hypothetical protein E7X58_17740 [Streptomyces sp. A1499]